MGFWDRARKDPLGAISYAGYRSVGAPKSKASKWSGFGNQSPRAQPRVIQGMTMGYAATVAGESQGFAPENVHTHPQPNGGGVAHIHEQPLYTYPAGSTTGGMQYDFGGRDVFVTTSKELVVTEQKASDAPGLLGTLKDNSWLLRAGAVVLLAFVLARRGR